MTIDYIPFDTLSLSFIFKQLNYEDEKIFDLIDYRFCTYIFSKGKNKGLMCCRKTKNPVIDNCCKQHFKYSSEKNKELEKNKNKYIKKSIIYYCGEYGTKKRKCRRRVNNIGDKCNYHCTYKIKNEQVNFKIRVDEKQNSLTNIKISEDIINDLRNINCNYILKCLGYKFIDEGTSKRYKTNNLNLVINSYNQFYENIRNNKGFGSIDLLINIFNYNFKESINFLKTLKYNKKDNIIYSFPCSLNNKNNKNNNSNKENKNKTYKSIPIFNLNNIESVKYYLVKKRKIDIKLIDDLISKKLLYTDNYKNCIFLSENKQYAYIRSSGNIKFLLTNGKPDFFKYKFGNNKDIYLFESPIDSLSFRTMYIKDGIYISTNGNTLINKVDSIPELKKSECIYCCFDNDKKGKEFDEIIIKTIKNIKINIIKPIGKDFNEDLIQASEFLTN